MKRKLICLFLCATLAVPAASDVDNPEWGDDRIIFAAQYNSEKAFYEGIRAGGSVLSAEKKCFARKAQHENVYGNGACERIKMFVPHIHEEESFAHHVVWHIVAPVVTVATIAVGITAFFFGKHKLKTL